LLSILGIKGNQDGSSDLYSGSVYLKRIQAGMDDGTSAAATTAINWLDEPTFILLR